MAGCAAHKTGPQGEIPRGDITSSFLRNEITVPSRRRRDYYDIPKMQEKNKQLLQELSNTYHCILQIEKEATLSTAASATATAAEEVYLEIEKNSTTAAAAVAAEEVYLEIEKEATAVAGSATATATPTEQGVVQRKRDGLPPRPIHQPIPNDGFCP